MLAGVGARSRLPTNDQPRQQQHRQQRQGLYDRQRLCNKPHKRAVQPRLDQHKGTGEPPSSCLIFCSIGGSGSGGSSGEFLPDPMDRSRYACDRRHVGRRAATFLLPLFLTALSSAFLLCCLLAGVVPRACAAGLPRTDIGYKRGCDWTQGRWVRDWKRPRYSEDCPFVRNLFKCKRYGKRPDKLYQKFSWYSSSCRRYARFDPLGFLRLLRNKTVAIVGDSLVIDNFVPSLLCQIHQVSPVSLKPTLRKLNGGVWAKYQPAMYSKTFSVPKWGVKVVAVWDDRLMRTSVDKGMLAALGQDYNPGPEDAVIDLQRANSQWTNSLDNWHVVLLETTTHWRAIPSAPTMIFTNAMWQPIRGIDPYTAHSKALRTIRNMFESRRARGKLYPIPYFMTAPPQHAAAKLGGKGVCGSTAPVINQTLLAKLRRTNVQLARFMPVQEAVFPSGGVMRRLDISVISAYRPEAHVGPYTGRKNKNYVDCLHWCMPGVPDIWSDLFYHQLQREMLLTNPSAIFRPPQPPSRPKSPPRPKSPMPRPRPKPKSPVLPKPKPVVPKPKPRPVLPKPRPVLPKPRPVLPKPRPVLPRPRPASPKPKPASPKPKPSSPKPKPKPHASPKPKPASPRPAASPPLESPPPASPPVPRMQMRHPPPKNVNKPVSKPMAKPKPKPLRKVPPVAKPKPKPLRKVPPVAKPKPKPLRKVPPVGPKPKPQSAPPRVPDGASKMSMRTPPVDPGSTAAAASSAPPTPQLPSGAGSSGATALGTNDSPSLSVSSPPLPPELPTLLPSPPPPDEAVGGQHLKLVSPPDGSSSSSSSSSDISGSSVTGAGEGGSDDNGAVVGLSTVQSPPLSDVPTSLYPPPPASTESSPPPPISPAPSPPPPSGPAES